MVVTGNVFKHLIFGGVSSADYGIYITGEAVYNAPTRAVEMVSVPGRNGDVPIDMGHWNNIEVTYTAGTFATTQAEFAEAVSNFRNAILPLLGYQRLEDTYNPNEYRLGIFTAGLDIEPSSKSKAGEFQITFNCKPQRWLKSGASEITIADGDTLTNPTGYDSSPLLDIEGVGDINIGDQTIYITDETVGEVELSNPISVDKFAVSGRPYTDTIDMSSTMPLLASGDTFNLSEMSYTFRFSIVPGSTQSVSEQPADGTFTKETPPAPYTSNSFLMVARFNPLSFVKGTAKTYTETFAFTYTNSSGTGGWNYTVIVAYDGGDIITVTRSHSAVQPLGVHADDYGTIGAVIGDSSLPVFSGNVLIDTETGDAYRVEGGAYISLNKYIQLGAQLPTLKPGANVITYENTITSLKITPRWWIL